MQRVGNSLSFNYRAYRQTALAIGTHSRPTRRRVRQNLVFVAAPRARSTRVLWRGFVGHSYLLYSIALVKDFYMMCHADNVCHKQCRRYLTDSSSETVSPTHSKAAVRRRGDVAALKPVRDQNLAVHLGQGIKRVVVDNGTSSRDRVAFAY